MLALQNDVFSELDQVIAQRLAYSIDHATGPLKNDKTLRQAADLLRDWNGKVDADAAAPAIVNAAREAFWPMLLIPKLAPQFASQLAQGVDLNKLKNLPPDAAQTANLWQAYTWGERDSVEEELVTHTPARWLPSGYANWEDFLAAVVQRGLRDAHAPRDLSTWQQGKAFPLDLEHPSSPARALLQHLIAVPTGTGPQPQSGDDDHRQAGRPQPSGRRNASPPTSAIPTAPPSTSSWASPAIPSAPGTWTSSRTGCTAAPTRCPSAQRPSQAATTHTLTLTPR